MSSDVFYSLTPYKKLMLTMETEMDYMIETASLQLDMLLEKKQLELKEAELTVLVEDGDIDMLSSLYTESEESSQSGVLGSLHKICDSIIGFIKNTMKLIKEKFIDLFSKHDDFTVEDFEKSGIKGVAYNIDYQKKMRELGSKMTEGELTEPVKIYTRNLTYIWCIFLLIQFILSVVTCFMSDTVWMIYNGFLSYVFLGIFFAIEYTIRIIFRLNNKL